MTHDRQRPNGPQNDLESQVRRLREETERLEAEKTRAKEIAKGNHERVKELNGIVHELSAKLELALSPPGFEMTYLGLGKRMEIVVDKKKVDIQTYRIRDHDGGTRVVTAATPAIDATLAKTPVGQRVLIGSESPNIIDVLGYEREGIAAKVVEVLPDNQLLLETHHDTVMIASRAGALEDVNLKAGSRVVYSPGANLALLRTSETERTAHHLADIADKTFEDIGGMEETKRLITRTFDRYFFQRHEMQQLKLNVPHGILLYGPPGTGKTTLAKALTNYLERRTKESSRRVLGVLRAYHEFQTGGTLSELEESIGQHIQRKLPEQPLEYLAGFLRAYGVDPEDFGEIDRLESDIARERQSKFLHVKGPEILDKWVGNSEGHVRALFADAREIARENGIGVIFIDECEGIMRRRGVGDGSSGYLDNLVAQFNAEMQGLDANDNVIVILSSNFIENMDPALIRAGRVDMKIKIDRPGRDDSRTILSKYFEPSFPYDAKLEKRHGSKEGVIGEYLDHAMERIFAEDDDHLILQVNYSDGTTGDVYFRHLVSGALLENIASRTKQRALDRAHTHNEIMQLTLDDLEGAIDDELRENKHLHSMNTAEEVGKYIGKRIRSITVPNRERTDESYR